MHSKPPGITVDHHSVVHTPSSSPSPLLFLTPLGACTYFAFVSYQSARCACQSRGENRVKWDRSSASGRVCTARACIATQLHRSVYFRSSCNAGVRVDVPETAPPRACVGMDAACAFHGPAGRLPVVQRDPMSQWGLQPCCDPAISACIHGRPVGSMWRVTAFDGAGFVPGVIIGFAVKFWLDVVNNKVPHMCRGCASSLHADTCSSTSSSYGLRFGPTPGIAACGF